MTDKLIRYNLVRDGHRGEYSLISHPNGNWVHHRHLQSAEDQKATDAAAISDRDKQINSLQDELAVYKKAPLLSSFYAASRRIHELEGQLSERDGRVNELRAKLVLVGNEADNMLAARNELRDALEMEKRRGQVSAEFRAKSDKRWEGSYTQKVCKNVFQAFPLNTSFIHRGTPRHDALRAALELLQDYHNTMHTVYVERDNLLELDSRKSKIVADKQKVIDDYEQTVDELTERVANRDQCIKQRGLTIEQLRNMNATQADTIKRLNLYAAVAAPVEWPTRKVTVPPTMAGKDQYAARMGYDPNLANSPDVVPADADSGKEVLLLGRRLESSLSAWKNRNPAISGTPPTSTAWGVRQALSRYVRAIIAQEARLAAKS